MVGQPPDEDLGERGVLLHGVHGARRWWWRRRQTPPTRRDPQRGVPPTPLPAPSRSGDGELRRPPGALERAHGRALSRQRGRRRAPPACTGQ